MLIWGQYRRASRERPPAAQRARSHRVPLFVFLCTGGNTIFFTFVIFCANFRLFSSRRNRTEVAVTSRRKYLIQYSTFVVVKHFASLNFFCLANKVLSQLHRLCSEKTIANRRPSRITKQGPSDLTSLL